MRWDTFLETALKADVVEDAEETATTVANPVTFLGIALHPVVVDVAVAAETATTAVNRVISRVTAPSQEAAVVVVAAATATCNATSAKVMDTCPANALRKHQLTTKS